MSLFFLKIKRYYIVTKIQFFIFPFLFSSSMNRRRQPAVFAFVGTPRQAIRARCSGCLYFPSPARYLSCGYNLFFMKKGNKKVVSETQFNAWGAKFPPWGLDNAIPQKIAEKQGLPLAESVPFIFEGGAIEVNGDGLGITTEDCLVGKNRNNNKDLSKVTKALCKAFGLKDLLVLPHGLHGDHTDGHIDNVARFVAKDRVVMCMTENKRSAPFG